MKIIFFIILKIKILLGLWKIFKKKYKYHIELVDEMNTNEKEIFGYIKCFKN